MGCGAEQSTTLPSPAESAPTQVTGAPTTTPTESPKAKVAADPAFYDAAYDGNKAAIQQAIADGVDVNQPNENGCTALMLAAHNGHTKLVEFLIKHKSILEARDAADRTALLYAASGKNRSTVKVLLEAGAKVDVPDNEQNWTALMFAAAEGNMEVVKVLLEAGADPTLADVDGETSVQFASSNGHTAVANLLKHELEKRSPRE